MGIINETIASFLVVQHLHKKILLFHIRDVRRNAYFYSCKYHREHSRVLSTEGTKSEALQGWLVKLGDYSKQLCTTVEILVNWLSNRNPPLGGLLCIYIWPPDCS